MDEVGYAHTLSKLKNLVASNSLPTYGVIINKSKYTKNYFIWNFPWWSNYYWN